MKAKGNFRPSRHGDRLAVSPTVDGEVAKPEFSDPVASAAWDRLITPLIEAGIVSVIDVESAQACCECWALYRQCLTLLAAAPTDKNIRVATTSYLATFSKLAAKFGLTPIDRDRLNIPEDDLPRVCARDRGEEDWLTRIEREREEHNNQQNDQPTP